MKFVDIPSLFGLNQTKRIIDTYRISLHVFHDMYHITLINDTEPIFWVLFAL